MKKKLFIIIIIWWILLWLISIVQFKTKEKVQNDKQNIQLSNFENTKKYLINNYKGNYPLPSWNLVIMDKTMTMIHLDNRNIPLDNIKNLYVIQWNTCNILKTDKQFQKINYDNINSIWTGKNILKRCFTYSVTKDRKNFQIWTIIKEKWKYVAKLDWTISKSITKSYSSPRLVKNWSEIDLPYYYKLSPIIHIDHLNNSRIIAKITDNQTLETKTITLHWWINYLIDSPWKYTIKIIWKTSKKTIVKFIDVDWNIINIQWNKNNLINFKVNDYEIKWKNKNYFVEAWKFLADILKLSDESNMTVTNNTTTLVIRWTKFSINATKDSFDTFLSLWHIIQILNGKKIDIDINHAFSMLKNNKIIENLENAKKIVSFSTLMDVINNPAWAYKIILLSWNQLQNTKLSWLKKEKKVLLNYENWQNIWILILDLNNWYDKFDNILKLNLKKLNLNDIYNKIKNDNWKWEDRLYKNFVNNICKYAWFKWWLDISKFRYILDIDNNTFWKLKLKDYISNNLWLKNNNYIILSSRHYNWQNSQILSYDPNDRLWIMTTNFKSINNNDKIEKVLVTCEK